MTSTFSGGYASCQSIYPPSANAPHEGSGWSGPLRCVLGVSAGPHEFHMNSGITWTDATTAYGPLPGQPAPAPEIVMEPSGVYWRRYPTHLSMVPVSDHNDPTLTPLAVYRLVGWEDSAGVLHPVSASDDSTVGGARP